MLNLQNETIARLRDRLKERGERPSLFATDLSALKQTDVPVDVLLRFDAICEAMYLMAKADGKLDPAETDTLKGALRELSDNAVRTVHVQKMIEGAEARLAKDGLETRIKSLAEKLAEDEGSAEAAFVLAAAVAFADDEIADEENDMLNAFAEALGIDADQANALLDEMQIGASPEA
ncbi:MAG: TerB family tellurite resistance protein [Deltaproteobacteria bacterium]|nr:TerB family tellurite resistance protein [Deltaproteobacteria bacterium]